MFLHIGVIDVVKIVIVGYAILRIDVVNIVILLFGGVVKIILQGIVKVKKCQANKKQKSM